MTDEEIEKHLDQDIENEYLWGWQDAARGFYNAPADWDMMLFYLSGWIDYVESVR